MLVIQKLLAGCQRGGSRDTADGYSSLCRSSFCIPVQGKFTQQVKH